MWILAPKCTQLWPGRTWPFVIGGGKGIGMRNAHTVQGFSNAVQQTSTLKFDLWEFWTSSCHQKQHCDVFQTSFERHSHLELTLNEWPAESPRPAKEHRDSCTHVQQSLYLARNCQGKAVLSIQNGVLTHCIVILKQQFSAKADSSGLQTNTSHKLYIVQHRVSWYQIPGYLIPDTIIRRYVVSEKKPFDTQMIRRKNYDAKRLLNSVGLVVVPFVICSAAVYGQATGNRRVVCGAVLACQALNLLMKGLGFQFQQKLT